MFTFILLEVGNLNEMGLGVIVDNDLGFGVPPLLYFFQSLGVMNFLFNLHPKYSMIYTSAKDKSRFISHMI